MEEPKLNIAIWISCLIGIDSFAFAVLTYFKIQYVWIICWLLIGVIFCIAGLFIEFYIHYRRFYKAVKDISDKHHALSKEFDKKNEILDGYETTFMNLHQIIIFALSNPSEEEKNVCKNIYHLLQIQKQKITGVKRNG